MVEVSFEINGRKVQPNQIGEVLTKAVLTSVAEQIKSKVGSVRCQDHGASPKIICKGNSIESLGFEVSGCCEKVIDSVKQKLS
jgi:hypothetical protein